MRQQQPIIIGISFLLSSILILLVQQEPFFWDTIQLGSRHANWFYANGFGNGLLPDEMDSGHIPAFGWYLAGAWKLLGRNLMVSHWAMLPWIFLVIWQSFRLVQNLRPQWLWPGTALLLADPTLLAQLSLISPDIILVGAFLLGVNSILQQQKLGLTVAVVLLGLVSLRGMMLGVGLFLWDLYRHLPLPATQRWRSIIQLLAPYLPGGLLAIAYLAYHYVLKGWIGVHDDSPWAASFAGAGLMGMVKQLIIVAWRVIDFGRLFLVVGLLLAWKASGWIWSGRIKDFLALAIIIGLILALPAIISPGLAQHRYLLPFYLSLSLLFVLILPEVQPFRWRSLLYAIVMAGLVSGHFWVYPANMAQGWDASLAHKPYFEGRQQIIDYLKEQQIELVQVATVFPEVGSLDDRELNNESAGFKEWERSSEEFVLYSNVMNDYPDEFVEELHRDWLVRKEYERRGVWVILFQRPLAENH